MTQQPNHKGRPLAVEEKRAPTSDFAVGLGCY